MLCALALAACSTSSSSTDPYETNPNPTTSADTFNTATADGDGDPTGDGDPDGGEGEMTPDMGEPDMFECNPWMQDCPDGDKCSWEIVDALPRPACVPVVDDARPPGEPCTMFGDPGSGHDDCERGAICSWLGDDNEGVCLALCGGSPADPSCASAGIPALCQPCSDCPSLCVPTCDPLAQDCWPGYACTVNAGEFTCTPEANVGDAEFGAPCEYSLQCRAGLACIEGELIPGCDGAGCCSPFCDLESPECPQGLGCEPWFEGLEPPDLPHVGICESLP